MHIFISIGTQKTILLVLSLIPILKQQFIKGINGKYRRNKYKKLNILFFDDMIRIKDFNPELLKIDTKSYKNIDIYYIGRITMKDSDYVKINSANPLYIIIGEADGHIEEKNANEYLIFASTGKNEEALKKCTEFWDKIKDLIKKINDKSGEYGKDFMKIKFNSDDNLPLNEIQKLHNLTITLRSAFQEDNKYPQVFEYEYLYEL